VISKINFTIRKLKYNPEIYFYPPPTPSGGGRGRETEKTISKVISKINFII
jgi:hypothetical protein